MRLRDGFDFGGRQWLEDIQAFKKPIGQDKQVGSEL